MASRPAVAPLVIQVPNRTSFVQSVSQPPSVVTEMKYTAHMITAKIGRARIRFVTILSILSEVVICAFVLFLTTESATSFWM